jgi:membrane-associated phospholipid phosphatase
MHAQETVAEPYGPVAKRAALWLLFLAPFFYLTYGGANWLASRREDVGSIVFEWERAIPFIAWTIVPYWSINLFYALSLFVNDAKGGLDRLAGRYLTAQVVAVSCFLAFPLAATFVRPETTGLPGFMFAVLGGFDKPFNQAPSLHIALLVIIWDHLRHRLPEPAKIVWHGWCLLIGASVLTTWQHHFIDIPTGALLGLSALWLFPRAGALPFAGFALTGDPWARRLGACYAAGAMLLLAASVIGAFASAIWLVLLWPALALAIVAFGYFGAGAKIFQKEADGTVSLASRLLLAPYRLGAKVNAWAWTRRLPARVEIADGVFLGRFPRSSESSGYGSVIDLASEFARPFGPTPAWASIAAMDLVQPTATDLERAAQAIEAARAHGTVLVCCALGFQRSAGAVAHWLISTGRAKDLAAAEAMLRKAGRPVHLAPPLVAAGETAQ